ncbi:MAG: Transmembrane exosortase (Exosortase_EpsH) [Pelotomaculum sp. PtaB.Bin104]|nr:MAG: Transmembrane exosortase (Exosortase_EpsH) [Pelotomaculum sp. PtaB.Bin104]
MSDSARSHARPCQYLLFLLPILATACLYRDTLVRLGKSLMTYENSHGLIILAISLHLVWSKRHEIGRLPFEPNMIAGAVMTVLGCALLVAGEYTFSVILSDVSLIVTLFGLVWLLLGTDSLKILALPVGYLIFVYPLFDYLPNGIIVHLQHMTAWLAAGLLKLIGLSVYHDQVYLELPSVKLQVVQVCAGMNHIIALLAVTVLLAHYTLDRWLKKIVLVAAALFVGLAANGIRVAVIGLMSMFGRDASLHGPGDIFYVSFVFLAGLAVMIGLAYLMGGRRMSPGGNSEPVWHPCKAEHAARKENGFGILGTMRGAAVYLPLVIATLIPASAFAYTHVYSPRPVPLSSSLANIPSQIGEWQTICKEKSDFIPADMQPDENLVRCYRNAAGDEVHLYVAYFRQQRQNHKVTDFTLNLYAEGEEIQIFHAGDSVTLRKAIPVRRESEGNTYFWYCIDGKVVSSRIEAKLALAVNGFVHQRTNGGLVAVRIVNGHESAKGGLRNDREIIATFLPVTQDHISAR